MARKWPRKWLFVLPNLFTVSSIFCGIYAITQACAGAAASEEAASLYFYRAAIAILFGAFFDGCDGRVARLTRTASEFGVQLDSLADAITFGVAPAILLYEWALSPWGFVGVLVAGTFATCGALRLARFNVMASRETTGAGNFFTGLPIPIAAGMVVAIVVAVTQSPRELAVAPLPIAILTIVLSWLMVSTVKYHSFKKVKFHARELAVLGAVLIAGVLVGTHVGPSFVLVTLFSGYILLGLVEGVVLHRRRREAYIASLNAPTTALLTDEEDDDDVDEDDDLEG